MATLEGVPVQVDVDAEVFRQPLQHHLRLGGRQRHIRAARVQRLQQRRDAGIEVGLVEPDVDVSLAVDLDGALGLSVGHAEGLFVAVVQRRADEAVQNRQRRDLVAQPFRAPRHAPAYALAGVGDGAVEVKQIILVFQSLLLQIIISIL